MAQPGFSATITLTRSHVVIVDSDPTQKFDVPAAEQLLEAYRHARSIVWSGWAFAGST